MSRTVTVFKETIGEPYEHMGRATCDVLRVELTHDKGQGHRLSARVQREGDTFICFALFTGISFGERLDSRKRFNRKALNRLADEHRNSFETANLASTARAELAKRKAEGKGY